MMSVWGLCLGAVNYLLTLLLCDLSGLDRASGGETGQRICRGGWSREVREAGTEDGGRQDPRSEAAMGTLASRCGGALDRSM